MQVLRIRAMARSMTAVLLCTLMVLSMLENLPLARAQDDLGQYQQEEAQEIQFNMQMQKLQAEGKMADKASGAQIGSRRRLVQDLAALQAQSLGQYQQDEAEDIELNQEKQKLQAEGYASDAQIGSRRRLVQDLGYVSKTSMSVLQYSCQHILCVMSYGVSVSTYFCLKKTAPFHHFFLFLKRILVSDQVCS